MLFGSAEFQTDGGTGVKQRVQEELSDWLAEPPAGAAVIRYKSEVPCEVILPLPVAAVSGEAAENLLETCKLSVDEYDRWARAALVVV